MTKNDPLAEARKRINALDDDLVRLLGERAALSREVGRIKRAACPSGEGAPVLKPFREKELLERLALANGEGSALPEAHLLAIYREILSSSRALQRPERVAYLGPEGTFSHYAASRFLGGQAEGVCCPSIAAVFRAVADNSCEFGLAPLENSLHGTVGETLDQFMANPVRIVSELYLRVRHCLISTERRIEDVRAVFSHPQALGQCSGWLKAHLPAARLIPVESTAAGAVRVASEMGGAAAIGHAALAARSGLRILADSIENDTRNWTRFVLIAARPVEEPGPASKTSVLFTIPHAPGTLASVLDALAANGANMTKLESRPLPGHTWEYAFFVDLTFDGADAKAQESALEAMRGRCLTMRVLGQYPEGRTLDAGHSDPAAPETTCGA